MRLSEYLRPDLVVRGLDTSGLEDTVGALVHRLEQVVDVGDPALVRQALVEREISHTTALGNGVALPHATVVGIERPIVMVATSPDGADFCPGQDMPVRLFFLVLSPMSEAGRHIKLLARIVRLVRHPGFVDSLLEAGSDEALLHEVERVDALHV